MISYAMHLTGVGGDRLPDPDDPERFRVTVTFDEQSDGKTVLTMRQLHPSRERRQAVIGFGAVEYGLQTLDGLNAWLDGKALAATSPALVQG